MRYLTVVIIALFINNISSAQTYEIGVYGGGANFIGDVGNTIFISPNAPALGIVAKWNRSSRHSFRFSAIYAQLKGDDTKSNDLRRQERGLSFQNNITEVSLGLEYTFWNFDMFKDDNPSTPYLYTGLTVFNQKDLRTTQNITESLGRNWNFAIPIVIGYKLAFAENLVFALEIGARYAITDNIDGSAPKDDPNGDLIFGNVNNNDWYMFTGFTITYTFGRKPCFCAF